jgi:hypothetical protein
VLGLGVGVILGVRLGVRVGVGVGVADGHGTLFAINVPFEYSSYVPTGPSCVNPVNVEVQPEFVNTDELQLLVYSSWPPPTLLHISLID